MANIADAVPVCSGLRVAAFSVANTATLPWAPATVDGRKSRVDELTDVRLRISEPATLGRALEHLRDRSLCLDPADCTGDENCHVITGRPAPVPREQR